MDGRDGFRSLISTANRRRGTTWAEPSDESLRDLYVKTQKAFFEGVERDRVDVESSLERERKFTVEYLRMSTNRLWARKEGKPAVVYDGTVEEYKEQRQIWPCGRDLTRLSVFAQIWDFFRFMWSHTKPYKTVTLIMIMSLARPTQTAILAYITEEVQKDPKGVSLGLYFMPLFAGIFEKFLYWWYEMWVPLNSQRVQLRAVLLSQRARLPDSHPLAYKWPSGRFNGLLKDVDDVINGIWQSCLGLIDDMVTMFYLIILCLLNLATAFRDKPDEHDAADYGVFVAAFLGLGLAVMLFPFLWFYLFHKQVQDCETMVRDGQALYMSTSVDAVAFNSFSGAKLGGGDIETRGTEQSIKHEDNDLDGEKTARKAFRVYGLTTFRSFFHRLAWTTNYDLMTKLWGPLVAYGLLTAEGFGGSFGITSTLIVLLSLRDLSTLSSKLLSHLISMSRGCDVLVDVAELLNANVNTASVGKLLHTSKEDDDDGGEEEEEVTMNEDSIAMPYDTDGTEASFRTNWGSSIGASGPSTTIEVETQQYTRDP